MACTKLLAFTILKKEKRVNLPENNSLTGVRVFKHYAMSKEIQNYKKLSDDVIQVIEKTRIKAYKSLTKYQLSLNFEIGKLIVESQEKQGWGKGVIDGLKGYSPQNLWRMRAFYLECKDTPDLLILALQVPWSQNLLIISKGSDNKKAKG